MNPKHETQFQIARPAAWCRVVALALALTSFPVVAEEAQSPAPDSGGGAGGPGGTGAAAIQDAKVAEEGDLDLLRARKLYEGVVKEYDALRPRAAEALFRLAEIARKSGATNEARELYSRVSGEFGGVGDFAQRSDAVLNEAGSPGAFAMSPELMRRYGLMPGGAGGAPPASQAQPTGGMDPAMAARYGIFSQPVKDERGQRAMAARQARYGGTGVAQGSDAETGGSSRTGTRIADPTTRTALGASVVSDEVLALRAEASANAARLRKLRRDLRVLAAASGHPSEIPVELIEDPQLLALIRACEVASSLQSATVGPNATADKAGREAAIHAVESAHEDLNEYRQRYTKRLENAVAILEQEADRLSKELDQALAREAKTR